jgi:hypothetical protein
MIVLNLNRLSKSIGLRPHFFFLGTQGMTINMAREGVTIAEGGQGNDAECRIAV